MFDRILETILLKKNFSVFIGWPEIEIVSPMHFEIFESIGKTNKTLSWFLQRFYYLLIYSYLPLNLPFLTNYYNSPR